MKNTEKSSLPCEVSQKIITGIRFPYVSSYSLLMNDTSLSMHKMKEMILCIGGMEIYGQGNHCWYI